jgi:hypothetical protein
MAEKVASLYAEVTAETKEAEGNLKAFRGDLEQTGSGASSLAGEVMSAAAVIGIAIGAAAAAALTMKEVFQFGAEGAQVLQVQSAFQNLMTTVGAAPDILNELRTATQGTVADFGLMAGSDKLLAGTSGELEKSLAADLPQLWKIAQAASDLNPQLGSTSEMFGKITAAIQSGRGVSLAQIGIALKMSDAYGDFGASADKAGSALTKEQQQEAILNAVMEKGNTIVGQAAGVNTQAAHSIQGMDASLKNVSNDIKAQFAPAIGWAADGIDKLVAAFPRAVTALDAQAASLVHATGSYDEYIVGVQKAAQAAGLTIASTKEQSTAFGTLKNATGMVVGNIDILTKSEYGMAQSSSDAATGQDGLALSTGIFADAAKQAATDGSLFFNACKNLGTGAEGAAKGTDQLAEALPRVRAAEAAEKMQLAAAGALALATNQQAAALAADALASGLEGRILGAMEGYTSTMGPLIAEQQTLNGELQTALNQGYSPIGKTVTELNGKLAENQVKQDAAALAMQKATAQMIYQQAAAGLDSAAALGLARAMGVISETDYTVATAVGALRVEFDTNKDGMISAKEAAQGYTKAVGLVYQATINLQKAGSPVNKDTLSAEMQRLADATASGTIPATVDSMGTAAPKLGDFATGMKGIGEVADPAAKGISAANLAMSNSPLSASTLKNALGTIKQPLDDTKQSAQDLETAIQGIKAVHVSVSTNEASFTDAESWIAGLASSIEGLPASKKITITVMAKTATPTPTGPPTGPHRIVTPPTEGGVAAGQTLTEAPVYITNNITNNIYDPLAAAILAENQKQILERRMKR